MSTVKKEEHKPDNQLFVVDFAPKRRQNFGTKFPRSMLIMRWSHSLSTRYFLEFGRPQFKNNQHNIPCVVAETSIQYLICHSIFFYKFSSNV